MFALVLCAYSVIVPLTEAPDEPQHTDLVLYLADGNPRPAFDSRRVGSAVVQLCVNRAVRPVDCPHVDKAGTVEYRPLARGTVAERDGLWTFQALGGNEPVGAYNELPQHPPLYYSVMAAPARVLRWWTDGSWPFAGQLAVLRLFNVAIVMWLPLLAWRAARDFGAPDAAAKFASIVPVGIPQLAHIGATVNNDNLLAVLGAAVFVVIARVVRGDQSRRTALLLGAICAAAVLTKLFAVVLLPSIALAYWVSRQSGPRRAIWLARVATVYGVVTAATGWWFVRNIVSARSLAPTIAEDRLASSPRPEHFNSDVFEYARLFIPRFAHRFWGEFGWGSSELPESVAWAATFMLIALVATGVAVVVRRSAPDPCPRGRLGVAVMLAPLLLLVALVFVRAYGLYARTAMPAFIQGRYAFVALVGVAVIAALGMERIAGRWAVLVGVAGAATMHVFGIGAIISRYYEGPTRGETVHAIVEWSPWPTWALWVGYVLLAAAVAWLLNEVQRETATAAN